MNDNDYAEKCREFTHTMRRIKTFNLDDKLSELQRLVDLAIAQLEEIKAHLERRP
jgi:hypothetical protein